MIGNSHHGTPEGTNSFRKPMPWFMKPMAVTISQTMAASAKVTMMWLVTVNE